MVLLQDLDANIMIEMDYVPVNNYSFHVVCIGENGIKTQGRPCKNVEQAVRIRTRMRAGSGIWRE